MDIHYRSDYNILKNSGVLYCATDIVYVKQAMLSAKSIKSHNSAIKCSICTSVDIKNEDCWDKIIPIPKSITDHSQYMLDKLRSLLLTPYSYTLYLDSDTYILDDISELFQLFSKFDLAFCHGHERNFRYQIQHGYIAYQGKKTRAVSDNIPYCFSPLQGGLILYSNAPDVKNWLHNLLDIYKSKGFFDDQAIMRELLWNSDLRFYILPREYNFNSIDYLKKIIKDNYKIARPKIFHYTKHKYKNIQKLVAFVLNKNMDIFSYFKRFFNV